MTLPFWFKTLPCWLCALVWLKTLPFWLKTLPCWLCALVFATPQLFIFVQVEEPHPGTGDDSPLRPTLACKSDGYTAEWQRKAYFTFLAAYLSPDIRQTRITRDKPRRCFYSMPYCTLPRCDFSPTVLHLHSHSHLHYTRFTFLTAYILVVPTAVMLSSGFLYSGLLV